MVLVKISFLQNTKMPKMLKLKKQQLSMFHQMLECSMSESEELLSASQLAEKLDITLQMLSVYVKAYSQLTKVQIKKVGRKGRHFDTLQVEVISNARDIVRTNTGVTVDEAMRRALVFDSEALQAPVMSLDTRNEADTVLRALQREVTAPIVEELRAVLRQSDSASAVPVGELEGKDTLRLVEAILERNDKTNQLLLEEIKGLRADLASSKEISAPPEIKKSDTENEHGLLVRFSLWVESVLRR